MQKLLSLKDITVFFGIKKVIENITFDLFLGEILTVLGPNGAGKSTLAKIIIGLIAPNEGKLLYHLNLKIGYVPQNLFINVSIPITVKRFMELKPGVNQIDIHNALERVDAEYLLHQLIQKLSVGEIQRVLLARALLNKPHLLVLDEPTQGLDIKGQIVLYNLINDICLELNCAVFIISHDLNLVFARTHKILCLNKQICCFGKPKDVALNLKFISMFGDYGIDQFGIYRHYHNTNKHYDNNKNN